MVGLGFRCLVALTLGLALALPAHADIVGKARVIDGDTIVIAGQRIRLHGIDAPESHQSCRVDGKEWPCGFEATKALAFDLAEHSVTCEALDRDRYRRIIAKCKIGPYDVGARMIRAGWALAYRRYSEEYLVHEEAAKKDGAGIWRGQFVMPWEWRRGKRLSSSPSTAETDQAARCCKVCRKGKACGDSCISRRYTCRKPPGCACDAR